MHDKSKIFEHPCYLSPFTTSISPELSKILSLINSAFPPYKLSREGGSLLIEYIEK